MSIEICATYYHPKKPFEYVVIEGKKNGNPFKEMLSINDFILDLVSFPAKPITDEKLFKRAEEVFLKQYK